MFLNIILFLYFATVIQGKLSKDAYKGQFCTDPRTNNKHEAYTEWADAYSCTRHRCQPGGRNLAIYTVGCKRVEAPESAIECEEVVEDTNMQFPYCCTRLRCLVVVRGEVWTRVLGQPWEKLPSAPWSHMYKMKRPPPRDEPVDAKIADIGPVFELTESEKGSFKNKALRNKGPSEYADKARLKESEGLSQDMMYNMFNNSSNEPRKKHKPASADDETEIDDDAMADKQEKTVSSQDKLSSTEEVYRSSQKKKPFTPFVKVGVKPEPSWQLDEEGTRKSQDDPNVANDDSKVNRNEEQTPQQEEEKEASVVGRSPNLQSLVNAIGTRMRDIESVVKKMSKKVQKKKESLASSEWKLSKDQKTKYLHIATDITTEPPLFEPAQPVYMAPVGNEGALRNVGVRKLENSEEGDKKHKKHKKKHVKIPKKAKKHHKVDKNEKRKRFNKMNSVEQTGGVSVEDSQQNDNDTSGIASDNTSDIVYVIR